MPGRTQFEASTTQALSPFALLRAAITAADNPANVAALPGEIRLGQAPGPAEPADNYKTAHALEHLVLISARRSGGTGDLVVTPFVAFDGSLEDVWLQMPDVTLTHGAAPSAVVVPFCRVKFVVKTLVGGSTWALHESHSID